MTIDACPACAGVANQTRLEVRENMYGRDESFILSTCAECGTLWLADPPEDLSIYYPRDYYSVNSDPESALGRRGVRQLATVIFRSALQGRGVISGATDRFVNKRQLSNLIGILSLLRTGGLAKGRDARILDVGCGSGLLVFALGLAGQRQVLGVDPFAAGDRTFTTGGELRRAALADVEGPFDLVMMHHSLEHVPSPEQTLREAMALLAPGGHILVRMPTPSSAAFERYGSNWAQLDPPRHVTLITREGVSRLCDRLGLSIASCTDDSTGFAYWGSEQIQGGTPLLAPDSAMVNPAASPFTSEQIREWDRRAQEDNAGGRGDQAAWVLRPSGTAYPTS